jgi:preprotein translocase subunit SecD
MARKATGIPDLGKNRLPRMEKPFQVIWTALKSSLFVKRFGTAIVMTAAVLFVALVSLISAKPNTSKGFLLTFSAQIPKGTAKESQLSGINAIADILRARLDAMNHQGAHVTLMGNNTIEVSIRDPLSSLQEAQVVVELSRIGTLTFRNADGDILLTDKALASAEYQELETDPCVVLTIKPEYRERFTDATKQIAAMADRRRNYLMIYLDEDLQSKLMIDARYAQLGISGDSCAVKFGSGANAAQRARALSAILHSGKLPFPLEKI